MTVIGGREAKQEKTKTIVQGSLHLQVDEEYLSNRPSDKPLCVPMCSEGNKGPYLDVRVYRSLVYFFQVQSQCNAGPYASFLTGVRDESAAMRQILGGPLLHIRIGGKGSLTSSGDKIDVFTANRPFVGFPCRKRGTGRKHPCKITPFSTLYS